MQMYNVTYTYLFKIIDFSQDIIDDCDDDVSSYWITLEVVDVWTVYIYINQRKFC